MWLSELNFHQFRNLQQQVITPVRGVNFIVGKNGSGKSSILEGIYYLARGRSFRATQVNKIISHEHDHFVLFGKLNQEDKEVNRIGIKRDVAGGLEVKVDGESVKSLSSLASCVAVQIVTPDSFNLFFGGPKVRRQFIDFGLFHVEHSFHQLWLTYTKLLKSRNALLKQRVINKEQYEYWDNALADTGEQLTQLRKQYMDSLFEQLSQCFEQIISKANFLEEIDFSFYQGWNKELSLKDVLNANFERDLKYGFTQSGPHKADLKIQSRGLAIQDTLSRGQLKLLLYILKVVQSKYIYSCTARDTILLFDDLPSEVDDDNKNLLADLMKYSASQVFVTCIDQTQVADIQTKFSVNNAMFHVEHGQIRG
ncbi:DNA replication/repair protein RecF [Flocculibacter collagenilyticus]|uniref:DNA replication/repair protein RecF n=1 Tax=Flocculibacter collagenilyticus TaxID=2744479 RepID=UPI0018F41F83|nr:DNA replication/repair protein RecF [Flocculibacter collagenilyticus]